MRNLIFITILLISMPVFAAELSLSANVAVNSIFNLSLDINASDIVAGDNITVNVNLKSKNLTKIEREIDIRLDFDIFKGKKFIKNGTFFVNVTQEVNATFNISSAGMSGGSYIMIMRAGHPQSIPSQDKDKFFIRGSIKMASLSPYHIISRISKLSWF